MRGVLVGAVAQLMLRVESTTPAPTVWRDKEVGLEFGMYDESKAPECPFPAINLQFSSEDCIYLDKDWAVWEQTNFKPPVSLLIKLNCGEGSASYKLYVDCEGASGDIAKFCDFMGATHCGRKALDASEYLEFDTNTLNGICSRQCIKLPEGVGGKEGERERHCINMRVNHCAAMSPAPEISRTPAPVWPDPYPGMFSAVVRLGLQDGNGCPISQQFLTPPFQNGDCLDLVKASGVDVPSSLSELGLTLAVKLTCYPNRRAFEYSTHTSSDCGTASYSDKLPSGWGEYDTCIRTDLFFTPTDVPGAPDMKVAIRQPVYLEVDGCGLATPNPPTTEPLPTPLPTGTDIDTPKPTRGITGGAPDIEKTGSMVVLVIGLLALALSLGLVGYTYRLRNNIRKHQRLARDETQASLRASFAEQPSQEEMMDDLPGRDDKSDGMASVPLD